METAIITLLVCLVLAISYVVFDKKQEIKEHEINEKYRAIYESFEKEIDKIEKLEIVGTGNDGNSDVEFIQAVKKISMPNNLRVQIYD